MLHQLLTAAIASLFFLLAPWNPGQPQEITLDLKDAFAGSEGCAVLYWPAASTLGFYQHDLCVVRVSPCSTFKIISTLAGLESGVIADVNSTLGYDGANYPIPNWNHDISLEEAFRSSCVWYYRKVIDAVGQESMQSLLNRLSYGNCDSSQWQGNGGNPLPQLNGFWLDSSLEISPLEQVQVLSSLFEGEAGIAPSHLALLRQIMAVETGADYTVYGKTGTGSAGGWFVGFVERKKTRCYFAFYQAGPASRAQEIGLTSLQHILIK